MRYLISHVHFSWPFVGIHLTQQIIYAACSDFFPLLCWSKGLLYPACMCGIHGIIMTLANAISITTKWIYLTCHLYTGIENPLNEPLPKATFKPWYNLYTWWYPAVTAAIIGQIFIVCVLYWIYQQARTHGEVHVGYTPLLYHGLL